MDTSYRNPFATASWIHLVLARCHPFDVCRFLSVTDFVSARTTKTLSFDLRMEMDGLAVSLGRFHYCEPGIRQYPWISVSKKITMRVSIRFVLYYHKLILCYVLV